MTTEDPKMNSVRARSRKPIGTLRRVLLCAVAVLIGLVSVVVWVQTRKPTYEGRSVGYWIKELNGNDPHKACDALLAIGPAAIPGLLDNLKRESSDSTSEFLQGMVPVLGSVAERLAELTRQREILRNDAGEVLARMPEHADIFVP